MKVVILCGGAGMRLREETEFRPKPMIEIGGRPILWHIMKMFGHHGFEQFVLCLGYRGQVIKEHFLNYAPMNNDFTLDLGQRPEITYHGSHDEEHYRVTLVDTGLEVSTGSRVARVRRFLNDDDQFMVTYGDGVADIDLRRLARFHESHGKIATVTAVKATSRWGVLEFGDDGHVQRFLEKPHLDGWISIGFFVFDRRIFDYLDDDPACVLEGKPMERLVADGQLVAYRHEGFFQAMDTYRELAFLNDLWDAGRAPWKVWARGQIEEPPSLLEWSQTRRPLGPTSP